MTQVEDVAAELDAMVGAGDLVGYVLGVRRRGETQIVAGGASALGGAPMGEDAQFPLSSNTKPFGGVLPMRLVELGLLELDAPIDRHLPELAEPRVLLRSDGPLDETVPAERPITLRHLLTMTAGFGWVEPEGPLSRAMAEQRIAPGPYAPPMDEDEYMRRLGALPLAGQPGRVWLYHNSSDVLGVLLARSTGRSVSALLEEHVFAPLGVADTSFVADGSRLPTSYGANENGTLVALDQPEGLFTTAPRFESLACGLVSTVADQLRFLDILQEGRPVLSRGTAIEIGTDQLTADQRRSAGGMLESGSNYGYQVEVRPDGAVGWAGGLGTIAYTNPLFGRSAALFTAQSFDTPGTLRAFEQFWRLLG